MAGWLAYKRHIFTLLYDQDGGHRSLHERTEAWAVKLLKVLAKAKGESELGLCCFTVPVTAFSLAATPALTNGGSGSRCSV